MDDQPELAQQFGISNIPTLVVMKDGKIVNKVVGERQKQSWTKCSMFNTTAFRQGAQFLLSTI